MYDSDDEQGCLGCIVTIIIFVLLSVVVWGSLVMHKNSLEHIAGHEISWWDAFWTY